MTRSLQAAELNFTIARTARRDRTARRLGRSTALNGTFQARDTLTGAAGALGNTLGNMLGGNLGPQVQGLTGSAFDQHADFRATVTVVSRPTIASNGGLRPTSPPSQRGRRDAPIAGV